MLIVKATALFVLVCLSFCAAEIRTTFNRHGYSKDAYTNHSRGLDDNLLAEIKYEHTTKASKPTKCQVSQETLDGKYKAVTCDVELDNHVGAGDVLLSNFDKDRVVISWWSESDDKEHQFIRRSIVHLSECKVFEANVDLKSRTLSALSWDELNSAFLNRGDGTFDVFYYEEDNSDVLRVTFDAYGKVVAGPIGAFRIPEDPSRVSVGPTSKKDLHIAVISYDDKTYELILFDDNESFEVIESFGELNKRFGVSSRHDTIRSCSSKKKSSDLVCKVLDENLDVNSTTTYKFNAVDVDDFAIYNLANNEFLLSYFGQKAVHLVKYGADGKQHGKLDLLTEECKIEDANQVGVVYENGDEICLSRQCQNETEYDVINYCFKNEDFK